MYAVHAPWLLGLLYPRTLRRMPSPERSIYLTFDDGPTPAVTPWVLDTLDAFNAKASFFVVGRNADKHPGLMRRLKEGGHTVGNHTYSHVNGWKTSGSGYVEDTEACDRIVQSPYFRPPYGRISYSQYRRLSGKYTIVLWSVLAGDFDRRLSGEQCLRRAVRHTGKGSIVVFHDSEKASDRLRFALPRFLEHFGRQGYDFRALPLKLIK